MTSLSREGFFSNGVTSAIFVVVGTIPVDIDKLTIFVMVGQRQVKCSFSNQVDLESSVHDVEGLLLISRLTSSSVAGKKKFSLSSTASELSWISRTLSRMNALNLLASWSTEPQPDRTGSGLINRAFTTLYNCLMSHAASVIFAV